MTALENAAPEDAARLFLEQMTEHHEGAIEMAEQEVEDGAAPGAIDLAKTIIDTQRDEIDRTGVLLDERYDAAHGVAAGRSCMAGVHAPQMHDRPSKVGCWPAPWSPTYPPGV